MLMTVSGWTRNARSQRGANDFGSFLGSDQCSTSRDRRHPKAKLPVSHGTHEIGGAL